MTNNELLSNIYFGWFAGGIIFATAIFVTFQIGLNYGIRVTLNLLEHEYPAAFKFVQKNKQVAKVIPYVVANNYGDE